MDLFILDIKPDHPKVPPGLVNSVPHSASVRTSAITPIPEPSVEASNSSGEKSYGTEFHSTFT